MPRSSSSQPDSWEPDDVWDALGAATSLPASPSFVDHVMRAVRLDDDAPAPWWKRWFLPASLGGLAAATAAVVLTFQALAPAPATRSEVTTASTNQESFEEVQDITDSETLVAAADYLDYYSDSELVNLISL